jgi:rsbT co-antagonist protein RsbR
MLHLGGSAVRLTQRTILIAMMSVGSLAAMLIATYYFVTIRDYSIAGIIITTGITGWILTYAYWRGWEPARYIAAAGCILANLASPLVSDLPLSLGFLITPIIILILAGPRWMVANTVLLILIGLARGITVFQNLLELGYYITVIIGLLIVHALVGIALRDAQESAVAADDARRLAERQLQENTLQAQQLQEQNEQQRILLDLVDTLETPTVSLADGVILAPIVGALDTRRANRLTERLLHSVHAERARLVILDVTGVPIVDTAVAQSISQTIQALRLLGCRVVLTGISAQVASTLTQLGVTFDNVSIARSPHEVIAAAGNLSQN